jgi:RNA polymerase sigma-70 factor (ECF subfamily)
MEQWVNDARTGDDQAWNFLHEQHYAKLYSLALGICGNTPEAKDAVQNTFITAFLKLADLRDNSAFGSWIKRILIHTCYRIKRKTKLLMKASGSWDSQFPILTFTSR